MPTFSSFRGSCCHTWRRRSSSRARWRECLARYPTSDFFPIATLWKRNKPPNHRRRWSRGEGEDLTRLGRGCVESPSSIRESGIIRGSIPALHGTSDLGGRGITRSRLLSTMALLAIHSLDALQHPAWTGRHRVRRSREVRSRSTLPVFLRLIQIHGWSLTTCHRRTGNTIRSPTWKLS